MGKKTLENVESDSEEQVEVEKVKKDKKEKKDKKDKSDKKHKKDKKDKKQKKDEEESSELEELPVKEPKQEAPAAPRNLQVFVSGIPYEANEAQLKEYFNQGSDKTLSESITDVKLPKYQDSGKCRGFAHVEFKDVATYEQGLAMTKHNMGARYLVVEPAAGRQSIPTQEESRKKAESMPEDCKTLFIKNLPYDLKEDAIGDRFRPFGEIAEIRISRNWQTNQSKGFAFVIFKEHISAKAALIKMNGKELKGYPDRQLKIDYDTKQKAKASYKTNMEDDGNTRFNKGIKKEEKSKQHHKLNEKNKASKIIKKRY